MLLEYIKKYIDQGFKIFPCSLNKFPLTQNGFLAASKDYNILSKQFYNNDLLIGFPTGNFNGVVVIDIDINKDGDIRSVDEIREEVIDKFGPLPETFEVETQHGGRHLYYKIVEAIELSSSRRSFHDSTPVDIRANGGYVLAPSGHGKYVPYDCEEEIIPPRETLTELPPWILEFKKKREEKEVKELSYETLPIEEVREIRSALSFLSSDDRDLWVKFGMALKGTGSPSAKGLWIEWSQKSDKYNPKEVDKKWAGFKSRGDITIASILAEAQKYGWVTTYENAALPLDNVVYLAEDAEIIAKKKEKRKKFPKELLDPGGFLSEIISYINYKSIKSQPILALGASLAAAGALMGRKYQTATGIRTNIYILGVGESGCGKDAARKAIRGCFQRASNKCGEMASIEDIASDAAVTTALGLYPSQVFLLDEIGRFLQTTNSAGSKNPHLYNIISLLLKLYSSSTEKWHGKQYADPDKQIKVDNPNLCIYGTTVPDTLYQGLTLENITDGFVSRMLIFESEDPDPKLKKRGNLMVPPPKELINKIKLLEARPINVNPTGDIDSINCDPMVVGLTDAAAEMLDNFGDEIRDIRKRLRAENRVDVLYNRCPLIAEQVALIVAISKDFDQPLIREEDAIYGINLVRHLYNNMLYIVENFISENDHEQYVKRIMKVIREAGDKGINLSQLTRKTQYLQSKTRVDILNTLKDSDQIAELLRETATKPQRIFVAT